MNSVMLILDNNLFEAGDGEDLGEAYFGFFLLNANSGKVLEFSHFGWENYNHPLEKNKKLSCLCPSQLLGYLLEFQ